MAAIRFFLDEDVYAAVATGLRRAGVDVVTIPEAGRLGESDESQLVRASSDARVLATFNVAHFAKLHADCLRHGRDHTGIVVSSQRPIGDVLRRLINLTQSVDQAARRNRIEFLSDW